MLGQNSVLSTWCLQLQGCFSGKKPGMFIRFNKKPRMLIRFNKKPGMLIHFLQVGRTLTACSSPLQKKLLKWLLSFVFFLIFQLLVSPGILNILSCMCIFYGLTKDLGEIHTQISRLLIQKFSPLWDFLPQPFPNSLFWCLRLKRLWLPSWSFCPHTLKLGNAYKGKHK